MDIISIKEAIDAFPKIDRLCLNIGGLGECKIHKPSGAVDGMAINTLGQVVLANGLIDAKKIVSGGELSLSDPKFLDQHAPSRFSYLIIGTLERRMLIGR